MTVSRASLDRWIRAWRAGGFDALIPAERQVAPRTDAEVLELAARLKAAPNQPLSSLSMCRAAWTWSCITWESRSPPSTSAEPSC